MNTEEFVERAKHNLDQIDAELTALEARVKEQGAEADEWATLQARKLRADIEAARADVAAIINNVEGEVVARIEDSKVNAQRHWEALRAAVKAYREHIAAGV